MTDNNKTRFISLIASTCAAAFGVQSNKNLDKDFTSNRVLPFIIAGLIFTTLFIGAVVLVVNLVLSKQV